MFSITKTQEFRTATKLAVSELIAEHNSHAYAAGYLESMVVAMFGYLPDMEQAHYLKRMQELSKQEV